MGGRRRSKGDHSPFFSLLTEEWGEAALPYLYRYASPPLRFTLFAAAAIATAFAATAFAATAFAATPPPPPIDPPCRPH